MCISGGKNVRFSEDFAYVPNEWSLTEKELTSVKWEISEEANVMLIIPKYFKAWQQLV